MVLVSLLRYPLASPLLARPSPPAPEGWIDNIINYIECFTTFIIISIITARAASSPCLIDYLDTPRVPVTPLLVPFRVVGTCVLLGSRPSPRPRRVGIEDVIQHNQRNHHMCTRLYSSLLEISLLFVMFITTR